MRALLTLFLVISLILEQSITTVPLVLITLTSFLIVFKQEKKLEIAVFALLSGIILDILNFRVIGLSALIFVGFLFLVLLYQRKFEIETPLFVAIWTFLASFSYLFIIYSKPLILESIASAIIGIVFFKILHG